MHYETRSFAVDVTRCPRCDGTLRVLALISHPETVRTILTHLGLPAAPPIAQPARAPPQIHFDDFDSFSW